MTTPFSAPGGAQGVSEKALLWVALYLMPLAAAVFAACALLFWEPVYDLGSVEPVKFKVLRDDGGVLSAAQAIERLQGTPQINQVETRLSEAPFWVSFQADTARPGLAPVIVFPSRHAMRLECWNQLTGESLGVADRDRSGRQIRPALGGFHLDGLRGEFLCRVESSGPARLTVQRWDAAGLAEAQRKFERNSGVIDGGVGILAVFVLMVAFVFRDTLIALFAVWLVANMRMAALSAGWDTQILEHAIPADWLGTIRALTIGSFYALTIAVFGRLFKRELQLVGGRWAIRCLNWSALPLLILAIALPYQRFLPVVWVAGFLAVSVAGFLLYRILRFAGSFIAVCYALSLAVILGGTIVEVIAAALGIRGVAGSVNSVTAAVFSSLLAAVTITEYIKREHQGRVVAQAELQHIYDVIPVGLFTLNRHGEFQKTNPALVTMLGGHAEADQNLAWERCFQPGAWRTLDQALAVSGVAEIELSGVPNGGGSARRFLVKAVRAGGLIEGSLQDITERHQATETLRYLSEFDALTEVLNRRGIEGVALMALERCSPEKPLAVAYLDLDRFKLINDLFGHAVGDDVLRQICERLAWPIKQHRLGRVGGDEFLVIMEDTNIALATLICQNIVDVVAGRSFESGGKGFRVGVSIGLVELLAPTNLKEVISTTDRACRLAKATGSGVRVFEAGSKVLSEYRRELGLIGRFGADRPPDGLFLVMQPILSLRAPSQSLNFEMLLRLRDPDGSIVPAGTIVGAAENSGRITLVDRWVLATTLAWLERNKNRLAKTRFVSMNLSGASLSDEVFIREAFEMLSNCPAAIDRLCLEVTESVALRDTGSTRDFIDRVRRTGIRVALDDFGAGYTSFSYLKALPADALKIDGSFVRDAASHPGSLAIIEAIAKLAHNFGMQTIAEWAEDLATLEALALAGIDHVQGYVVSRPVGEDQLLQVDSTVDLIQDPKVAEFVLNFARMRLAGSPAADSPAWSLH